MDEIKFGLLIVALVVLPICALMLVSERPSFFWRFTSAMWLLLLWIAIVLSSDT